MSNEEILELKLEMQQDQKEFRHEIRNTIMSIQLSLEVNTSEQKLLTNKFTNMENQLIEIKNDMKEGFNDIKIMFKELPSHFATKEEHKINQLEITYIKERQWKTDKIFAFVTAIIGTTIIGWILTLILK